MPRTCTICTHPDRAAIDQALVVEKSSFRDIARQWRVSKDAIARHQAHIPAALVKAQEAKEVVQADTLLGEVRTARGRSERLYQAAEDILERALASQDLRTALKAIAGAVDVMREARAHLELKGELTGELKQQGEAVERAVIIIPAVVPLGTPAPLNARLPEAEVQKALARFERGEVTSAVKIIDVEPMTPPEVSAQIPRTNPAELSGPWT